MTFIGVWPLPCVTLLVPHIYTPVFISEWVLFAHGVGLFLNPWPHVCLFIYDFCFDILISSRNERHTVAVKQFMMMTVKRPKWRIQSIGHEPLCQFGRHQQSCKIQIVCTCCGISSKTGTKHKIIRKFHKKQIHIWQSNRNI
jgi:hypothetical protein